MSYQNGALKSICHLSFTNVIQHAEGALTVDDHTRKLWPHGSLQQGGIGAGRQYEESNYLQVILPGDT